MECSWCHKQIARVGVMESGLLFHPACALSFSIKTMHSALRTIEEEGAVIGVATDKSDLNEPIEQ